jgi:hypothetical protein
LHGRRIIRIPRDDFCQRIGTKRGAQLAGIAANDAIRLAGRLKRRSDAGTDGAGGAEQGYFRNGSFL